MSAPLLLALDLGTTTLAGRLLAGDGTVLAEARRLNPQRETGADVILRLEAALRGEGARLQQLLCDGIAALLDELLQQADRPRAAIAAAAAAANPAITTLLCGDDPRPLLFPPHRPRHPGLRTVTLPAAPLPLPLELFPLVSGYVGGDLVAGLYGLPSDAVAYPSPLLLIDLGTNAELALSTADGWLTTSVAAGPAFEGGEISCGMVAGSGAIVDVVRDDDRLRLTVLGGGRPAGLAGSGLFAAIGVAVHGGLIDRSGRIVAPEEVSSNLARYLVPDGGGHALQLYRDAAGAVRITQQDLRAFQLARGAVRAGVEALLQRSRVAADAVATVLVSGSFGLSLPVAALKSVAILPADMVEKTLFVPSAALAGVGRYLRNPAGRSELAALVARIKAYPLSGTPAFERAFLAALDF